MTRALPRQPTVFRLLDNNYNTKYKNEQGGALRAPPCSFLLVLRFTRIFLERGIYYTKLLAQLYKHFSFAHHLCV